MVTALALPPELKEYERFNSTSKAMQLLLDKTPGGLAKVVLDAFADKSVREAVFAARQSLYDSQKSSFIEMGRYELDPENPPVDGTLSGEDNPLEDIDGVKSTPEYFNVSYPKGHPKHGFWIGSIFTRLHKTLHSECVTPIADIAKRKGATVTSRAMRPFSSPSIFKDQGFHLLSTLFSGAGTLSDKSFLTLAELGAGLSVRPLCLCDFLWWVGDTKGFTQGGCGRYDRHFAEECERGLATLKKIGPKRIVSILSKLTHFPVERCEGTTYHHDENYETSEQKKKDIEIGYMRTMNNLYNAAMTGDLRAVNAIIRVMNVMDVAENSDLRLFRSNLEAITTGKVPEHMIAYERMTGKDARLQDLTQEILYALTVRNPNRGNYLLPTIDPSDTKTLPLIASVMTRLPSYDAKKKFVQYARKRLESSAPIETVHENLAAYSG